MSAQYIPVLLAFGFAAGVAAALIGVSALLGRGRPGPSGHQGTSNEGEMAPPEAVHRRGSVTFFLVALVFTLFAAGLVFLLPWALAIREFAAEGATVFLPAGLAFIAVLGVGDIYLWKAGAFDWGGRGSGR